MKVFVCLIGKPYCLLWHQVSFISLPVFCTSSHSPNRNGGINQSWKGFFWVFLTVGEKGHVTIFVCLELSALVLQKLFYSINYRTGAAKCGKTVLLQGSLCSF